MKKLLLLLTMTMLMLGMNAVYGAELQVADATNIASYDAVNPVNAKLEEEVKEPVRDQYPNPVRDMMATFGKITEISNGQITVVGEGNYPQVTVNINADTYLLDGKTGKLKESNDLDRGRQVTVYYSSRVTRSIPPQSNAYAVVFGKNSEKMGKYTRVYSVAPGEDSESVVVLNSNRDIEATVTKAVYSDYDQLKEGDSLMLWYSMMTMSIPGKTNAQRVIKLNK